MADEQETTPGQTQILENAEETNEACSRAGRAGEGTIPLVVTPPPPPSQ